MASDTVYQSPDFALFDSHHWEDWIELCCIANLDGEIDINTALDRLGEDRENSERDISDEDGESTDEIDEDRAKTDDRNYERVKGWFLSLANRARTLGDTYPFELNSAVSKLTLRAKLSSASRLYIALLMMANLHNFSKNISALTSSFESLGLAVFRWLLPIHAEVHHFGKGPDNKGRYQGHIWKKIKQLGDDIGCATACTKEEFAHTDNGDGGLDLVGWVDFGDSAPGRLLLLGQCACTPEWPKKQDEASGTRWAAKLDFVTKPMTVILIPYFLRTQSGAWHRRTDFSGHLVIDRLRMLRSLAPSASQFSKLPALKHVAECLANKEGAY